MKKIIAILAILGCVFAYSHADGYKYLHTEKVSSESASFLEFYLDSDFPAAEELVDNVTSNVVFPAYVSYGSFIENFDNGSIQVFMGSPNRDLTVWDIVVFDGMKPIYMNRVYSFDTAYSIYQSKVDELVSQVFSN